MRQTKTRLHQHGFRTRVLAAYDGRFLGVRPDLVVEVNEDLLEEVDGPMLQHGIQALHRQRLRVRPR